MRFLVLTAQSMKIIAFWDRLVALMMEVVKVKQSHNTPMAAQGGKEGY
jgi:hypothetical protein